MKKTLKLRQMFLVFVWGILSSSYTKLVNNMEDVLLLHLFIFFIGLVLYKVVNRKTDECPESRRITRFFSIASLLVMSTYIVTFVCSIIHSWNYIFVSAITIGFGYLVEFMGED